LFWLDIAIQLNYCANFGQSCDSILVNLRSTVGYPNLSSGYEFGCGEP